MTDHALRLLRENPPLAELAAFPFGFDLDRARHVEDVRLASGGPLEPVAGDDSGGTYFVCGDGSLLYADSEGSAGVIGAGVDEALEIMVGLPAWQDCLHLSPQDSAEVILADVQEAEDDVRESYSIDEERAELRTALGFADRSPVELIALLHAALLRTEPHFVLLNAEEGLAYRLLDEHPRPPLWEQLGPVETGTDPASEPLRKWTGLALDRGLTEPARVALIRHLDEIHLNQGLLRDPGAPDRLDTSPLEWLAADFTRLGDVDQALRARRLHAALQETVPERVVSRLALAGLERRAGRLPDAVRSLADVRQALTPREETAPPPGLFEVEDPPAGGPPADGLLADGPLADWARSPLGRAVAEEHLALAGALADAGSAAEAGAVLAEGEAIRGELPQAVAESLRELAEGTARRVGGVS
jgi:hypothetical protein